MTGLSARRFDAEEPRAHSRPRAKLARFPLDSHADATYAMRCVAHVTQTPVGLPVATLVGVERRRAS